MLMLKIRQIYHQTRSLLSKLGQNLNCLQIYFMRSTDVKNDQWYRSSPGIDRKIVVILHQMLHEKTI